MMHQNFDYNRSSSFGDYLSNKNSDRQRTDKQTDGKGRLFCALGFMIHRENMKVASRPMDLITVLP